MTLNGFIIAVIILLFGYNAAIVKWHDYQEKKHQRLIEQLRQKWRR